MVPIGLDLTRPMAVFLFRVYSLRGLCWAGRVCRKVIEKTAELSDKMSQEIRGIFGGMA
jgi:hypothetical protein